MTHRLAMRTDGHDIGRRESAFRKQGRDQPGADDGQTMRHGSRTTKLIGSGRVQRKDLTAQPSVKADRSMSDQVHTPIAETTQDPVDPIRRRAGHQTDKSAGSATAVTQRHWALARSRMPATAS